MFENLGGVKAQNNSVFFPANHTFEVTLAALKFFKNREGNDTFVIETTVDKSSCEDLKPGTSASQVIVVNPKYRDTRFGNIKSFAAMILQIKDPDTYLPSPFKGDVNDSDAVLDARNKFWQKALTSFVSDKQPAAGTKLALTTVLKKNKTNDGSYTVHNWSLLENSSEDSSEEE